MLRRLYSGFAFSSLRTQLLLWIALPVAVSLFGISLMEIRGHEQVMERMVQEQAELLALSVGGMIDAHIDQRQTILWRLAAEWVSGGQIYEPYAAVFDAGLALYGDGGIPVERRPAGPRLRGEWQTLPAVQALVRQVQVTQIPDMVTLENGADGNWLLIQAAPVNEFSRDASGATVLVGASNVREMAPDELLDSLSSRIMTELRVTSASGEPLLLLGGISDPVAPTDKVASAQTRLTLTDWRVSVRQDWEKLAPPLLRFANASLVIVGIAVVISLLSAYFGLYNIVRPLRRLDDAASEVAWGNFEAIQKPVGGVAEIEELRIALARMTEQIQRYQKELQSYIGAMTRGQEEERRRLARDLHDETIQDLIALTQQVELVEREIGRDAGKATKRLQEVRPLLSDTIAGLRRQIHNLRPLYLEDLGFVPALEMLVRQISQRHHVIGDFDVSGQTEYRLAPAVEISAFRIVQEALNNVAAHAEARWVHVELIFGQDGITLRIEDDGRGFVVPAQPYELAQQGQFGLLGMKERAQLHGGKLQIESALNQGTTVLAWLPAVEPAGKSTQM